MRQARHMEILSRLVIRAYCDNKQATLAEDLEELRRDLRYVVALEASQWAEFLALADSHHVTVRALTVLHDAARLENEHRITQWCAGTLAVESARIERAVACLDLICNALESQGCRVAVIKSLDHWPDLGSDLDLYTTGEARRVERVMREDFAARAVGRSWGDWLANKWNYKVPGLPELVEIHVQYLGQTGEYSAMAQRIIDRRISKTVGRHCFHVPAAEERIVIATLQRLYRHFYFRLCDMIDVASLLQVETVDFGELKKASCGAGIWPGVATFLCLVERYVESYDGILPLPEEVIASAHAQHAGVRFKGGFLRAPKATAAGLYGWQLFQAGLRHDVRALVRLPLLPPLAVSALLVHGLTGSDKGVW